MAKDKKKQAKTPEKAAESDIQPIVQFVGQYLKDASFECVIPSFIGELPQLKFDLQVAVKVIEPAEKLKEVIVTLKGVANNAEDKAYYVGEISAAGVFHVENLAPEQFGPMLAIDGAAMIFPLARQALLSSISDGSYPSPAIGPIDFRQLYENNENNQKK